MRRFACSVALALLVATPSAAAVECALGKPVKAFANGKWSTLAPGTAVSVQKRGPMWTYLTTPGGQAKAAASVVEAACPATIVMPVDASDGPAAPAPTPAPETIAAAPVAAAAAVPSPAAKPKARGKREPVVPPMPVAAPALPAAPAVAAAPAQPAPIPALPAPPTETTAPAAARKMVAILDLRGGTGAEATAQALTTVLTAEVAALEGYSAVSRNELVAILAHQADAQLLGCDSLNCMASLGKLADADLVISGSVDRVSDAAPGAGDGAAWVLALTLVETSGPTILDRQEAAWRGPPEEMLPLARPLAARLFAGPNAPAHVGNIEVFAPGGAQVVVDGRDAGVAPLKGPLRGLGSGVHNVGVTAPGKLPLFKDVVVARDETTVVRAELEDVPLFQQPIFWVAAGGVALLAGGTAAGAVTWAVVNQDSPPRALTGKGG